MKKLLCFCLVCCLLCLNSKFSYAGDDYLEAKGDIKTKSIDFDNSFADTGGFPSTPVRGELYYDFGTKFAYYRGSSAWIKLQGTTGISKSVATRIVAAQNSLDKTRADIVCDGSKADNAFIQDAITALGTIGGAVYLLEGTYNISASININQSNVSLIGAGKGTVLKASFTGPLINVNTEYNILLSMFMIDGNNLANMGVSLTTATDSKINRLWIENLVNAAGITCAGIYLNASSDRNIITRNLMRNIPGTQNGRNAFILLEDSSQNIISDNTILSGSLMDSIVAYGNSNNNIISRNNIQSTRGLHMFADNNIVTENFIQDCYAPSTQVILPGSHCIISSNIIKQNVSTIRGIWPSSSYGSVLNNNFITGVDNGFRVFASFYNVIYGNCIYENAANGILLDVTIFDQTNYNLISSNNISKSGTQTSYFGIKIEPSSFDGKPYAYYNYLVGNHISGTGFLRPIDDVGLMTHYTDKQKLTLQKRIISSAFVNMDVVTIPVSYVGLMPASPMGLTLTNGNAPGDLLILENCSTNLVTIADGGTLDLVSARQLSQYDTLELIWNGTAAQGGTGKWLEVKYVHNNL